MVRGLLVFSGVLLSGWRLPCQFGTMRHVFFVVVGGGGGLFRVYDITILHIR